MTHKFKFVNGNLVFECNKQEFIYLTHLLAESNEWKTAIQDCNECTLYGSEVEFITSHLNNYRLSKKIDMYVEEMLK